DYRHRMYHPGLGRFLQADPLGLKTEGEKLPPEAAALFPFGGAPKTFASTELNLFGYCQDDPINYADPTGLTIVPAKDLVDQWKKTKAELIKDPLMRKIISRLEQKDVV